MIKVLPSSNPCPEENLVNYARSLEDLGVDYLHCDVMDGVFVENKCLSIDQIANVRNNSNILLDVHLMVANPLEYVEKLIKLKPSIITVHIESVDTIGEMEKIIKLLKANDILFGLAIKPSTSHEVLKRYLDKVDVILVMSVEPGKSGQKFIPETVNKMGKIRELIERKDIILEVDGGIKEENAKFVVKAGADFLVMGTGFYDAKDKAKLLAELKEDIPVLPVWKHTKSGDLGNKK